ncbi:hypothetical protein BN10_530015 [Phycicoccus elongatus Lp2]|uniref:Transposase n=1 Tax=Phycicoccus elongatus Lp2 TaxID=1193181 RepID=N0E512_9MICO|nr:hypothetical protein BN10_530015 [Phycicoccus elongatus Lp2]
MIDSTSVLFGLEDDFVVISLERLSENDVRVVIEQRDREAPCPACGVFTSRVKERPLVRVKDLAACGQVIELWWRKRRLACAEALCGTGSFTQQSEAIPTRARLTSRLREVIATEIASGNRAVEEVARTHGVSWPTAHRALVAAAARWLPAPESTRVLGIDETRARSVRWVLAGAGWRRTDPWLTSFVDADTTGPGWMLGLAPGRSGACVKDWLSEQSPGFRAAIEVVVIDTSAPYASGIRAPAARADRGRQVAPGRPGQHHGHRGPAAGHPRTVRSARHHQGAGVGQPAAAAHRVRAPVRQGACPVQGHPGCRGPHQQDRRRLGRQRTPPTAARRDR